MRRTTMMVGGLVVVAVVLGVSAVMLLVNGDDDDAPPEDTVAPPANGEPAPDNGAPGEELPDDVELPDELDPAQDTGPPPEALAFVEEYGVADSVLHLAIEEERHEAIAEPGGRLQVLGDVWVELDETGAPLRFAARYYDEAGEMVQAVYQDRDQEVIAYIEETRLMGDEAPECVQEGAGDQQLLAFSVPFLIQPEALEADGFTPAEADLPGEAPETPLDDRVGEPQRVLSLAPWSEASIFERADPETMMQQYVLLDPESDLLLGQLTLQEMENGETEMGYRQGVGDIHVHERGAGVDPAFDLEDAIQVCEELQG